MKTDIAIIVPNWNGAEYIADCLHSLETQTAKALVIVVDNGSSDKSVELIQKKFPAIEIVRLEKNHGFAGGVNKGLELAIKRGYKYAALLNNDAVAETTWLQVLVATANQHPKTGVVTGKLLRDDKKHIDSTGELYSIWGMPFPRGRNEVDKGQYDDQTEIFAASGGASLYRVEMLKEIGLFDEDFFAYFEDVDLSFRAQLAGWRVRYEPLAVAYHKIGATSSKYGNLARYHSVKNFMFLYKKNMPGFLFIKYLPLFLAQYLRMFVSSTLRLHLWTFMRATLATVLLDPKIFKQRRKIQSARTVSTKYIDSILHHHRPPHPQKLVSFK
ncbi:MAG TPA: glycosyltransferase family 2 protein [Candidatus Saccharimonadales bacterium]|nr:glycosyltransferase family 2 protein [Candidatus Saccharimonadales bacterium]